MKFRVMKFNEFPRKSFHCLYFLTVLLVVGLYRISAPVGIRHFFQILQKSGCGKNPTGAGFCRIWKVDFSQTLDNLEL